MSAPESVTITLTAEEYDADAWRRFATATLAAGYASFSRQIEAQLPKPKPKEPKGLGAVVKGRDGAYWVRVDSFKGDNVPGAWESEFSPTLVTYRDIDVVEVLSEGVWAHERR